MKIFQTLASIQEKIESMDNYILLQEGDPN